MTASRSKGTLGDALAAYRQQIIPSETEKKIADLAAAVKKYDDNRRDRAEQEAKLAERQREDEDSVFDAYETAKSHGAKATILADIGLKPDAALTAARSRRRPPAAQDGAESASPPMVESTENSPQVAPHSEPWAVNAS